MYNSIYIYLYTRICLEGISDKKHYGPGSGLHKHHIQPKHSGGKDVETNYTYLTVQEHITAHHLLYLIHNQMNDLRAMHMLGANLTTEYRRKVGEYCRDNQIGFHNPKWDSHRSSWTAKGIETQRKSGSKDTFHYWSTPEGRKERAILGGIASVKSGNNPKFTDQQGTFKDKDHAKKAGKLSAKKPATNGIETKKFHTEAARNFFIDSNPTWRIGHHWSNRKKPTSSDI